MPLFLQTRGVRRPKLKALPYRHDPNYRFVVDLRALEKGRRFFRTREEAEIFARQQKAMLAKHGQDFLGLSKREMSEIIQARQKLAEHRAAIAKATEFFIQRYRKPRDLTRQKSK
jgi:thymidylate kinase